MVLPATPDEIPFDFSSSIRFMTSFTLHSPPHAEQQGKLTHLYQSLPEALCASEA
jgi:hypothetical protein